MSPAGHGPAIHLNRPSSVLTSILLRLVRSILSCPPAKISSSSSIITAVAVATIFSLHAKFGRPAVEAIAEGSTVFWLAVTVKHRLGRPPLPYRDRKALAKTSRRSDTESSNMPSNPRNHQYLFPFRGRGNQAPPTLLRAEMFYIAKSMPPPSATTPFATAAAPLNLFR